MAIVKTEALLLKTVDFSDSSLIIQFFTREHGRVSIIAKGARRSKSKFMGYLEPLGLVEIVYHYKSSREIQILSEIGNVRIFLRHNTGFAPVIFATAMIESLDRLIRDHQQDEPVFKLAVEGLTAIDANPDSAGIILLGFFLQLTRIIGYGLDLHSCSRCYRPLTESWFHSETGDFLCASCHAPGQSEHLAGEMLGILVQMAQIPLNDGFFQMQQNIPVLNLIRLILEYLAFHLDFPVRLKSLDLLDTLRD